jgi:malate dehydrogenase (oxaloacetate-decarboxylating)(NADP+)
MAKNPIVFAMANPEPEMIAYDLAIGARKDIIMATGRSDFPNQVNNVLGFPYIFRGALDVRATAINEEMKIAAVKLLPKWLKSRFPKRLTWLITPPTLNSAAIISSQNQWISA